MNSYSNPFRTTYGLLRWPSLLRDASIIAFVLAVVAYSAFQSRMHYEQQAEVTADNLSQLLGEHISTAVEKIDLVLKTVVRDVSQQQARGDINRHDLEVFLAQQQLLLSDAKDLLIADSEGVFTYGADVPPGFRIEISNLDYFKRLKADSTAGLVIDGPYQNPFDRQWVMVFARRIMRPDGSFAGIVSSAISADHFREMLSFLNLGAHGTVVLRTGDMKAIARFPQLPDTELIGNKAISTEFGESLKVSPEYGRFRTHSLFDSIERTVTYRQLPNLSLYIILGLAPDDYLAAWRDEAIQLVLIAGAFIVFTLWLSRTARRVARRQRAVSQLLQEAVENVAIGFAIFDPDDRLVICNQATKELFPDFKEVLRPDARFADIIRTMAITGLFPDALANIEQWVAERVRQHQLADGKHLELKLQDGRELLVIDRRTPSSHTVVNIIDITELSEYRRHLERLVETRTAKLKAALDQFRILVELSPTALAMFDRNLNYLAASQRWLDAYGYGQGGLVGKHIYDAHPDFPEHWKAAHRAALSGVADGRDEDLWVQPDGSKRWLRWAVHPWVNASGNVGGIIISAEDISARKRAELALAEEREAGQRLLEERVAQRTGELQAANRQLEGFLFAASHDLRGPLGRISSFSSLLETKYADRLDGDGLLFLKFIRENAKRLSKLIDDLLNHTQVDRQAMELQSIDLPSAVQACLQEMAEDIRENSALVRLILPPAQVLADPYGLHQVIYNLLENALKYSATTGKPIIEIGGEELNGRFRLSVKDNGIGFDMEYHDRIFQIFRRLHTYAEYAGTGIGLTLVKRAMERMGGSVWAESEPGRGATFYLEFASVVA